MSEQRQLKDLAGIGKAGLQDFHRLGIISVQQLAACVALELFERLSILDGQPHDICVLDTLRCAVAQARDPHLPLDQCNWWWWSRQRKAANLGR